MTAGKLLVGASHVIDSLLEKKRRFYPVRFKTIVDGQESFESKIKPRHFTGRGLEAGLVNFQRNAQVEITHCIPFDRYRLWLANQLTVFDVFINPTADSDTVTVQKLVAGLLERETFVLVRFFERGWSDFDADFTAHRFEKELVALFNPLHNVLQGLRGEARQPGVFGQPFEPGQVFHQSILVQVFTGQSVVSLVECDAVVVGTPGQRDGIVQMPVSLRLV